MAETNASLNVGCLRQSLGKDAELVETHISWVLLAGGSAYKIKKPVDLGFVDFTTLDRRRHFCHEELRLNRRLAPHLYRGVTPITGTHDSPSFGGSGGPIDYAVVMERFEQEALLSRVLERGELRPAHVDRLASGIAAFHAQIDAAGEDKESGDPGKVWFPVAENFRHLNSVLANRPDDSRMPRMELLGRLERWSRQEFDRLHGDFHRRKRDGFVRECHGDMHLGNMILEGERVTIFDCIEFNESLRWIDVLSEAAFAVMDLEDRGRPDYARRLLNTYLEATGDYGGLSVVPFYLTYRALVRAKVAALRLAQPGLDDSQTLDLELELDGYLELAEQSTQSRRAFLAITHGLSGSGKTSGTQCLVDSLGAIRVRSDVERKRLFGVTIRAGGRGSCRAGSAGASPSRVDLYSAAAGDKTYARLAELAQTVLAAGFPVVVDATFLKRGRRDEFRQLAAGLAVPFVMLSFHADPDELRRRVADRQRVGADASDASVAVLEQQLACIEPLSDDERQAAIAVDRDDPGLTLKNLDARVSNP